VEATRAKSGNESLYVADQSQFQPESIKNLPNYVAEALSASLLWSDLNGEISISGKVHEQTLSITECDKDLS
jgi:hypothetical protein